MGITMGCFFSVGLLICCSSCFSDIRNFVDYLKERFKFNALWAFLIEITIELSSLGFLVCCSFFVIRRFVLEFLMWF